MRDKIAAILVGTMLTFTSSSLPASATPTSFSEQLTNDIKQESSMKQRHFDQSGKDTQTWEASRRHRR